MASTSNIMQKYEGGGGKDDEVECSLRMPLMESREDQRKGDGELTVEAVGEEIDEGETEKMREEEEKRVVIAMNMAVKSAGNLGNLLPTGTLLFFQFLLPIVSEDGKCTKLSAGMTISLIAVCAATCFLLSFSDTVKTSDGKLHHGFATPHGMWLPVSSPSPLASANLSRYRLHALDFLHAFLSLTVFLASAFSAPNVVDCLLAEDNDPVIPSQLLQQSLPLIVGFVASFLCILFPSHRRGYDRPLLERLSGQEAAEAATAIQ